MKPVYATTPTVDRVPIIATTTRSSINEKPNLLSTFDYIYDSLGIKSIEENQFKS